MAEQQENILDCKSSLAVEPASKGGGGLSPIVGLQLEAGESSAMDVLTLDVLS